ncbi:PEP phosphonomutase-like protein [Mariannaea sp. PMI_226]|nr:PEP phosphonomutase-like protein [Mariannaea sp. PMI_226]
MNLLAKNLKDLHRPHSPLILANVYDAVSAKAVASLPAAKAIATASFAVAEAAGLRDEDLTRKENFRAAGIIASAIKDTKKPLSVDFQDGYGDQLEDAITELIQVGVVGVNLEDYDKTANKMYGTAEAADRVKRVLAKAASLGVPDFVVNARCDALVQGRTLKEVIARGEAYLNAGATTVFVWGGQTRGGVSRAEVVELVDAFGGRLNVLLKSSGGLTAKELADIGVARISIGPTLQFSAMEELKKQAQKFLAI